MCNRYRCHHEKNPLFVKQYETNSANAQAEILLTEETIGKENAGLDRNTISNINRNLQV
jgi:hypothetical protein